LLKPTASRRKLNGFFSRKRRVARREEIVDHDDALGIHDPVGELQLAIDGGAGVLAVDVEPPDRLVHRLQVELGGKVRGRAGEGHDVRGLGTDRLDRAADGRLIQPQIAQVELLVALAIGGEDGGRTAPPDADLEQIARNIGLLVEQGAPDAIGLEHEPARNRVDFLPTEHPPSSFAAPC